MADDQRPYASLYVDALLALAALRDPEAKDVFLVLLKHANSFGLCNPGDDLLARLSCHRRDAVPTVLNRLEALNFIHIIYTPVPFQRPHRSFQVNPAMMALRPECQAAALKEWESFIFQTTTITYGENDRTTITYGENDRTTITYGENDRQPPESPPQALPVTNASESTPVNTTTNHQAQKPPEGGEDVPVDLPSQSGDEEQNQGEGRNQANRRTVRQSTARSATSEAALPTPPPPSPSPPSPEPDDLAPYQEPLADTLYERVAQELYLATGNMSTPTARMLVTIYGPGRTQAALRLMGAQPPESVGNRAGYVRSLLRRHAVSERDRMPGEPSGHRYITGEYADYIEH